MNFEIQSTFEKTKSINQVFILACLTFTVLFHKAGIGLNLALFSLLLLTYWFARKKEAFKLTSVRIAAAATVISALATTWYGTGDTILWTIICLMVLSQFLHYPQGSMLFWESKTLLRFIMAPWYGMISLIGTDKSEGVEFRQTRIKKILVFLVLPLCFTLLFASLYQNLNPIFADYFKRTLDMIDFSLLITIALGIAVISIAILQVIPERILLLDRLFGNNFNPEGTSSSPNNIERQGGIILFSLLNITLFIFLLSDVFFLQDIWQGVADEYAHYVHQGVGLLIFSIVIATALILYYFRNAENALLPGRNALKILAITWVFLNIGITCSTAAKNLLYVGEYSLSLKRIGVFIYLLLALTGLVVTLVKLYKRKTNAFLIRQVYWSFFILLTLNICIDWSTTVVRYNIHQHIKYGQELDWAYLLRMDTRTLPQVDAHRNEIKINDKKEQDEFRERLAFKRGEATQYAPDWREMHVARLYAQSYYIQP